MSGGPGMSATGTLKPGPWGPGGPMTGDDECSLMPGGFFVAQRFKADFDGMPIESLEIIGYDPETDSFPSTVYANMAATPLADEWVLDDDDVTIKTEELGATFHGRWSGKVFAGGWRPNPGRDGPGNVPYDVSGHRA